MKISDEEQFVQAVWDTSKKSSVGADLAGAVLRQAKSFQIRRDELTWTARDKLIPLHLAKVEKFNRFRYEGIIL